MMPSLVRFLLRLVMLSQHRLLKTVRQADPEDLVSSRCLLMKKLKTQSKILMVQMLKVARSLLTLLVPEKIVKSEKVKMA